MKENQSIEPKSEGGIIWTILKVLGLFSLVPLVFGIPFILSSAGEYVLNKQIYLVYLWILYFFIILSIFFHFKKSFITWQSFVTQMLAWGVFTLGAYVMVDLPRFLPFHLRQVCLYLWCSFTMPFNILVFFLDDTNYQELEKKEAEKEERKKKKEEEKKKKLAEKGIVEKKKDLFAGMNPTTRLIVNIFLYIAIFGVIGYFFYDYYLRFQERLESGRDF